MDSSTGIRGSAITGMVYIPAGPSKIGSDNGSEAEAPQRIIELGAFWIDATPVTNAQFEEFVRETGFETEAERRGSARGWEGNSFREVRGLNWRSYASSQRALHPVVLVSWDDAKAFASWKGCRLPSEFEWEVAAAGGLEGRPYPWGITAPDGTQCNWNRAPADLPPTTPVNAFPPNQAGIFDMVGNVWQWCENEIVVKSADIEQPARARRGGAWNVIQDFRLRCANRGALSPEMLAPNVGFRCATSSA